jgi:hypothetical protein
MLCRTVNDTPLNSDRSPAEPDLFRRRHPGLPMLVAVRPTPPGNLLNPVPAVRVSVTDELLANNALLAVGIDRG